MGAYYKELKKNKALKRHGKKFLQEHQLSIESLYIGKIELFFCVFNFK
jgi:hypothetical protein